MVQSPSDGSYALMFESQRRLFGYPLFAAQTCAELKNPSQAHIEHQFELTHTWLPFLSKSIKLPPPEPANLKLGRPENLPVATSGALVLHLSQPDQTFDYRLSANGASTMCAKLQAALLCNLDKLSLKQGDSYDFKLERLFDGRSIGTVYEHQLETVNPVKITGSSIKSGETVQDIPAGLTLTASKPLKSHDELNLYLVSGDQPILVETSVATNGKNLSLKFAQPLTRSAKFELRLGNLTALDEGYLLKPYSLRFTTSGGPKVIGASIGTYGVNPSQNIVLALDAQPKSGQKLNDFIKLSGNFQYSLSQSGKQIVISPIGSWPRCARFSIQYRDGLKNRYGVSGGSAWQFDSRTLCQTVSAIGSSVEGRGIYVYRFGSGSQNIIFVGGTHGDETSSIYTLTSWIDWLEANYDLIPGDKTVIVVPNINPDGSAAGQRTNSRDVDLNRNFPANNWKQDVIMPGGSLNKGGGGSSPLSEPESSALASYVPGQNPKLVLTYHAVGSLVIANESGSSSSLGAAYAQQSGFWALDGSASGGIFTHDTTGAFEDWLHDKYGIPALLIELSSYYGNEFWNHQSAMWSMVKS